jgi:hypothetical protein
MRGLGCLMCNTAVERGALPEGAALHVDRYLERLHGAFSHALENGRDRGELDAATDVPRLAGFLTMSLVGVAALVRAAADPDLVQAACDATSTALEQWGAPPAVAATA